MKQFTVNQIGTIHVQDEDMFIQLDEAYRSGLKALVGFGHISVVWWFDGCDFQEARSILETPQPYKGAPEVMGIFATRSPARPNLVGLSVAQVLDVDYEEGIVRVAYIDANDNTPLLDIKPYTPSLDRVSNPEVPGWCAHWPMSVEESAEFEWEGVFNF